MEAIEAAGLPAPAEGVPVDGRRARRHRSRDIAVDALLDLLNEGVHRPTAHQVAERSGVSLRSIFRIFDDVQGLLAAATERHLDRVRHLFVDVENTGTLEQRAANIVATTAGVWQSVAPVRRAALRVASEAPPVQEQMQRSRRWLRHEIERVFAPEIEGRSSDPGPDLAATVEVLLSFEGWDQLRHAQQIEDGPAQALTVAALVAILG